MAVKRTNRRKNNERKGKPIYAALVQPMPTDVLWEYRSSDRTRFNGEQRIVEDIKANMRRYGPQSVTPLFVEYDPVYKEALVVDGQKRLVAAREVGMKRIPVGVISVCRPPYGHGPYGARKVPTARTERIRDYQECKRKGLHEVLANPYDVFGR